MSRVSSQFSICIMVAFSPSEKKGSLPKVVDEKDLLDSSFQINISGSAQQPHCLCRAECVTAGCTNPTCSFPPKILILILQTLNHIFLLFSSFMTFVLGHPARMQLGSSSPIHSSASSFSSLEAVAVSESEIFSAFGRFRPLIPFRRRFQTFKGLKERRREDSLN